MAQTFNPDNVTVLQKKDGSIPLNNATELTAEVLNSSIVTQLGKYEEMDGLRKEFTQLTDGGGAYWVNETQKIATAKAKMVNFTMEAKKLGVIIPVSNEYLEFGLTDFFAKLQPYIVQKFNRKFDEAVILGKNNPFKQSIARSIANAGTGITGDLNKNAVFDIENKLYENGQDIQAFISTNRNITALRQASLSKTEEIDTGFFKRESATMGQLDGLPIVNMQSSLFPKGTLLGGNFDHLHYGIPKQMTYQLLDQAQLSTLTNEDGSPINLAEQDMKALRVTMYVATLITKDEAFAGLAAPTDDNVFATMPGTDTVESTDPDSVANTVKAKAKTASK
ncbi:phage major capsid protein [Leuconostoc pseudomesenteroides]|uniref:phage major capsid protein n=1 Tax=Leuconostoc pseudomesenteroides TaxID=33968 RepID=UPI0032DE677B